MPSPRKVRRWRDDLGAVPSSGSTVVIANHPSGGLRVFMAFAKQIPTVLEEIGRLREETFIELSNVTVFL